MTDIVHAHHRSAAAPLSATGWLALAAAPTFAAMALLTAWSGSDALDAFCVTAHGASPFTGMGAMYVLMSVFHLKPWMRMLAGRNAFMRHR